MRPNVWVFDRGRQLNQGSLRVLIIGYRRPTVQIGLLNATEFVFATKKEEKFSLVRFHVEKSGKSVSRFQ